MKRFQHFFSYKSASPQTKWLFAFLAYFLVLLAICILAYLRILPVKMAQIPYYDTIGHFFLLGIAAYLAHYACQKRRVLLFSLSLPLGPLLVSLFAISDESIQTLSPYRTFSLSDLAASLGGILCFYWLAKYQSQR